MTFDYWTFGNAGAVLQLLNAVAAILAPTSGIVGAVQTAALLGFMVIVAGGVLKNDPTPVMIWFIGLAIGWYVIFVPRVTMVVVDQTPSGTSTRTVANVPLGLGFVASAGSKLGYWLTTTAETVFALPEQAKFTNVGLMAPHRITLATLGYSVTDPVLAADWQSFFHECTYYDINVYRKVLGDANAPSQEELMNSTDPLSVLAKTNHKLFVHIYTGPGGARTLTCNEAYAALYLATRNAALNSSVQLKYAKMAFPSYSNPEALTAWTNTMSAAQNLLFRAPIATHQMIMNRWMLNLLKVSGAKSAITSGNTGLAIVEFNTIQAEQARLNAYLQSARAAQDTIPAVRNVLEAVCIGVFPVILIVMVMVGVLGLKLFFEWALFYLSLQLWGFAYALMNMIMISKSSNNIFALAAQSSGADVALSNAGMIAEELTADMAMTGSMAWAIPLVCYGLVKGTGMAMSSMATSLASTSKSTAEQMGAQGGTGNVRSGEGRFAQSSAPNALSIGGPSGTSTFFAGQDAARPNLPMTQFTGNQSSAVAGVTSNQVAGAALSVGAEQATTQGTKQAVAAESLRQAAVGQAVSAALTSSNTSAIDKQWQQSGAGSFTTGQSATQQLVNDISSSTGATSSEATRLALGAGLGTPKFSPVDLNSSIGKQYGAEASARFNSSQSAKDGQVAENASKFVSTLTNSTSSRQTAMGGSQNSKGVEGALRDSAALKSQSEASLSQAQSLKQQASAALSGSTAFSSDIVGANPGLAKAISDVAASPDFKADGAAGNYLGQQDRLRAAVASAGLDAQALAALVPTSSSAGMPATPASMPGGGATPTQYSLQGAHADAAGQTQAAGNQAVNDQWAKRPNPKVGGPNISGVVADVNAGQSAIQGQVTTGQARVATGSTQVEVGTVPHLPMQRDGSVYTPKSQIAGVAGTLVNSGATAATSVMNTLSSALPGGDSGTPDPFAAVNARRAELGKPPIEPRSSADQIPRN